MRLADSEYAIISCKFGAGYVWSAPGKGTTFWYVFIYLPHRKNPVVQCSPVPHGGFFDLLSYIISLVSLPVPRPLFLLPPCNRCQCPKGLADAFIKMRLPFESDEAATLNRDIFETIYFGAVNASVEVSPRNAEGGNGGERRGEWGGSDHPRISV